MIEIAPRKQIVTTRNASASPAAPGVNAASTSIARQQKTARRRMLDLLLICSNSTPKRLFGKLPLPIASFSHNAKRSADNPPAARSPLRIESYLRPPP